MATRFSVIKQIHQTTKFTFCISITCFVFVEHNIFIRFIERRSPCFAAASKLNVFFGCVFIEYSMQIVSEEGSFKNADGKKIFTKYWKPSDKKPRWALSVVYFLNFKSRSSKMTANAVELAQNRSLQFFLSPKEVYFESASIGLC